MRRLPLLFLFFAVSLRGQPVPIAEMPQPARQGNTLRFESAQAVAAITPLSPEIVRVRITPPRDARDDAYAVINRNFDDPGAAFASEELRSAITTSALQVTIQRAPFRIAFATKAGQSLDEDQSIAIGPTGFRDYKRLRDDDHVYALGEKNGPLDKRGWKLGGYSVTMWNSDTFGYDSSTDPIYVSVPFYIVLRHGVAFGIFLDNTFRTNFDIGHQTEGTLSFGADGGALDYYFIYGPDPKDVIRRYTALTGRMPLPPLWALGYHQCRYSYFPESRVRFIAANFRERKIPADAIWLDIHYQDNFKPFTWDHARFPDPPAMISDLRKEGFRVITIVDPHPKVEKGYLPYDSGIAADAFVKNPDGTIYTAPVWPSQAPENPGPSVFADYSKPSARAWWGGLYSTFLDMGVAGIWNDMNEPAVFDVPSGTMPLDVRHDNEGNPTDHREIHNVYGMLMSRSTYEGLRKLRPNERPFILSRASFAGGQRYSALWPGDNTSDWSHLRQSIPTLLGLGLSGFPFVGSDIGGFAKGSTTAELFTRWLQLGVFYPFMRDHTMLGSPDQEPWAFGPRYEAINRRAIELRYQLLPYIYSAMHDAAQTGIPAMRPLMLEFPRDEKTYNIDDQFLFGSDLLVAPVLLEEVTDRDVYLPAGDWYDYWSGAHFTGGKTINVKVTLESIPIFVRGGSVIFAQPVVQSTNEMAGQPLRVIAFGDGSSELYEDAGNGFGPSVRRRFTIKGDTVEISAPDGTYRPQARELWISVGGKILKVADRFERMIVRLQ